MRGLLWLATITRATSLRTTRCPRMPRCEELPSLEGPRTTRVLCLVSASLATARLSATANKLTSFLSCHECSTSILTNCCRTTTANQGHERGEFFGSRWPGIGHIICGGLVFVFVFESRVASMSS